MNYSLNSRKTELLLCLVSFLFLPQLSRAADPTIAAWANAQIRDVAPPGSRHTIHTYYLTCPESPDGKYVLYYTSAVATGEQGDLRLLDRATGVERVIVSPVTTEDAHRVACQQWVNGGKTIVYHNLVDGHWRVMAYDVATGAQKVLAMDRQLGMGAPQQASVPIIGLHWNPGAYKDFQLVHVETGAIQTIVTAQQTVSQYTSYVQSTFGTTTNICIYFPVLSPDGKRAFFKLSRPSNTTNYRTDAASFRDGLFVYDLVNARFIRQYNQWGHPSWHPDSRRIFEKGNRLLDPDAGTTIAWATTPSDHPSISPNGYYFVTDADISNLGIAGEWGIFTGPSTGSEYSTVARFIGSKGATSWRKNHPHPRYSPNGQRIYYNVNDGTWTHLMVASLPSPPPTKVEVTLDNAATTGISVTGVWTTSTNTAGFYGSNYMHDGATGKGSKSFRFTPTLPFAGNYEVFAFWPGAGTRSSNVPFAVTHAGGTANLLVDQRIGSGTWVSLGIFGFNSGTGGNVLISNAGTTNYVIVDALRFRSQ